MAVQTDEKRWQLAFGSRDPAGTEDPITTSTRMSQANQQKEEIARREEVADLEHKAKMKGLKAEVNGDSEKEKKELAQENKELKDSLVATKVEQAQATLGAQVTKLGEEIERGKENQKTSFSATVGDIVESAEKLKQLGGGSGGGLVEQMVALKELMTAFNPQLDASDQIEKWAGALGKIGYGKQGEDGRLQVEIEKLRNETSLRIEEIKDARQDREAKMELEKRKWDETKGLEQQRIQAQVQSAQDNRAMVAEFAQTVGRAIADASMSGGGGGNAPQQQPGPQDRAIMAGANEGGHLDCQDPRCGVQVPVAPDATQAVCPGCNTVYNVKRK